MKTKIIFIFTTFFCILTFGQNALQIDDCNIIFSKNSNKMLSLKSSDLSCLAQTSKKNLIVYVYEFWCKPCNEKIMSIQDFAKKNNFIFLVMTIESEGTKYSKKNEEILSEKYQINNIGVLSDTYGRNMRKKYKSFLSEISDKDYDLELSKIIFYDKLGEIRYISKISDELSDVFKALESLK